ncbi:MAG: reverse transcriptase/maturase family protein [Candidatus Aminicenantes bacterium]
MKRYGYLFEKIIFFDNLMLASKKAIKGKKHKDAAAAFYFNLENEIIDLQEELKTKIYIPLPLRIFMIREPKVRVIGAAEFRDRVVHHAICNILEPIFEKSYIYHSYACRKGKGTHRAIRQAQKYCRSYEYFLKCDIKKYFESIHHLVLKKLLKSKFKDPNLLWLLDIIIDSPGGEENGIPIGNLTSQHFANFYLDKLDHYIKDVLQVIGYLRYMDDFILFDNDRNKLKLMQSKISDFLFKILRLELKEKAIILAPCQEGIPFLGFRIFPNTLRVKRENKKRWIKKFKTRIREFESGLIDEEKYSRCLMSLTEHLKQANTYHFRRRIFNGAFI